MGFQSNGRPAWDKERQQLLLPNLQRPPVFSKDDFRPLPYSSIWIFRPREVMDFIRKCPAWRGFCLEAAPNYFNILITKLTIMAAMVEARNKQKKTRWKVPEVCSLARDSALKPNEGGQFILLENFLTEGYPGAVMPSVIPLILPQKILAMTREDGSKIILEFLSPKKVGK